MDTVPPGHLSLEGKKLLQKLLTDEIEKADRRYLVTAGDAVAQKARYDFLNAEGYQAPSFVGTWAEAQADHLRNLELCANQADAELAHLREIESELQLVPTVPAEEPSEVEVEDDLADQTEPSES